MRKVTTSAPPLSLAEALLQSPQQLSLASSLTPPAPGSPDSSSTGNLVFHRGQMKTPDQQNKLSCLFSHLAFFYWLLIDFRVWHTLYSL